MRNDSVNMNTIEKRREALVAQKTQEAKDAKTTLAAATLYADKFAAFTRKLVELFDGNLNYVITEYKPTPRTTKLSIAFANFNVGTWNAFITTYANAAEGTISVEDLRVPMPATNADKMAMYHEFSDNLLPYLFWRHNIEMPDFLYGEGPYEVGKVALRPGDVVLDCGANVGMFSAFAARKGCKVHAFEPMDYTRDTYLSKTAALNPNIKVYPLALGDKEREAEFALDVRNIGGSHEHREGDVEAMPTQAVQMTTVDKAVRKAGLKRVDFIKADIEGAERHMLAGAANTIRKHRPRLAICTYHRPDDPKEIRETILDIEPSYRIVEKYSKLYAWCE